MQFSTPHHALPLLASGQAQKEITHNEALIIIDALLAGTIESAALTEPPSTIAVGQMWLVAANAGGVWSGQSGRLALMSEGGWRYIDPPVGSRFYDRNRSAFICLRENGWVHPLSIGLPSGGSLIDAEARATLANIKDILTSLGLAVP